MTQVLVRLVSDDPSPVRIQNSVVEFYNTSGVFQTSGTTDVNGEVQVTLPDASYDVMFFKMGVSILPKQPQRIVVDTALVNHFQVTGHVRTLPESTDPRLCTVSGRIPGANGTTSVVTRMIFEPLPLISVINGQVISPYDRYEISSDEDGYFQFELLRNFKYNMYFLYPEDLFQKQPGRLDIYTPDMPAVNLADLLFPLPVRTTFSNATFAMNVGDPMDKTSNQTNTYWSDGSLRNNYGTDWGGVALTNSDCTVVVASLMDGGQVSLLPVAPGTATITMVRSIPVHTVYFSPTPAYVSDTLVVTIS